MVAVKVITQGLQNPGLDIGMGRVAAFGGPIGLTVSGFYFIIDATIGWDNFIQGHISMTIQNQAILGPGWNAFRMEGGLKIMRTAYRYVYYWLYTWQKKALGRR